MDVGKEGASAARDPVCGMEVAADARRRNEHAGSTYRFCSERCLEKFRQNPEKYLTGPVSNEKPESTDASAIYTCP
ncbi:MAG: YHS domain-containing protein, partial [Mariprofundaceae bacterium]|nr:YHS domain-containing protein [Mariprofundaceae bacterium]